MLLNFLLGMSQRLHSGDESMLANEMIRFENVTKSYPGNSRPAVTDINLDIVKGEFVFLVGASGSGKSSLLRLVLREEKPQSGNLHVLGQNLRKLSNRKIPYLRRQMGVVFQDFRLLPNKTVAENIAFTLQVIGKSRGFIQQAVPDVIRRVGLDGKADRYPHELSGGEQQRVAIARAIVNKPSLLLADEPTGNLDPTTSAGIVTLLKRINAGGTTILMATHDVSIVNELQKRVVELSQGRIIRDESGGGYQTQAVPQVELDEELEAEHAEAVGPSSVEGSQGPAAVDSAESALPEEPKKPRYTSKRFGADS